MTGLLFIKVAYAGTGSANDFYLSILTVILFLAFILGIIMVPPAIKRLHIYLNKTLNSKDFEAENFDITDEFDH